MKWFQRVHLYLSVVLILVILVWISLIHSGSAQCSCYAFDGHQSLRSWSESQSLCQQNKGDLVSMETVEEWEFIKTQIQNKTTKHFGSNEWWIGLVRRDGEWKWLSNHTLTYDRWQQGKPDDIAERNYVRIAKNYPRGTYGLFANMRKSLQRGTICEYKKQDCSAHVQWCAHDSSWTTISTKRKQLSTRIITSQPAISTETTFTIMINTTSLLPTEKRGLAGSPTQTKHIVYDCLPYPLFVIAIFVSVVGGLTVLSVAVLYLVSTLKKKCSKPSDKYELPEEGDYENQL